LSLSIATALLATILIFEIPLLGFDFIPTLTVDLLVTTVIVPGGLGLARLWAAINARRGTLPMA
jgi:hypothetical protein